MLKARLADRADGELFHDFRIENQAAAHQRFAFTHRFEPEDALLRKPVLAAQDALHFEALFQVVACEDELGGFAGGQDTAVVRAFNAAEFGKVAAFGKVFGNNFAEKIRL